MSFVFNIGHINFKFEQWKVATVVIIEVFTECQNFVLAVTKREGKKIWKWRTVLWLRQLQYISVGSWAEFMIMRIHSSQSYEATRFRIYDWRMISVSGTIPHAFHLENITESVSRVWRILRAFVLTLSLKGAIIP